jgi:hypothetical protein
VQFIKEWPDYFPHVAAEELRANWHQAVDSLQGRRHTYMVGEVFNLPLVSECVDFSRYLIRREFGPTADPPAAADGEALAARRKLASAPPSQAIKVHVSRIMRAPRIRALRLAQKRKRAQARASRKL